MPKTTLGTERLGMTDLEVFPIGFGTWQLGGEWGEFDEDEGIAAIRQARELGVNLFDTAQGYGFGESERVLGKALRDDIEHHRDEVVIATKGGLRITNDGLVRDSSPDWLRSGVDAQPRRPSASTTSTSFRCTGPTRRSRSRSGGRPRGPCRGGQDPPRRRLELRRFSRWRSSPRRRPVETLQPPYDLFRRDIEAETLPHCREHDIGVLLRAACAWPAHGTMDENTTFASNDWRSGAPLLQGQ